MTADPDDPKNNGEGVEWDDIDINPARDACEKAIKLFPNLVQLQYQLGRLWEKIGNRSEADEWYRKAAEQGKILAMIKLTNGPVWHTEEGFKWNRKLANLGYVQSMHTLSDNYLLGMGVSADKQLASYWKSKAKKLEASKTQKPSQSNQRKTASLRSGGKMCRPPSATEEMPSHRGSREVKEHPGHYRTGPGSTTTSWYVWDPVKGGFYGEGYRPQDLVSRDLLAACGRAGGRSCYRIGGCIGKHTDRAPFTTATVGIAIPKDRSWAYVGCAGNKPAAVQQAKRLCESQTGCQCDSTEGLDATTNAFGPKAKTRPQRQSQSEDVLKDLNRYKQYTKKWWTIRCKNPTNKYSRACGCIFLTYQQERSDPSCNSTAWHREGWCQQGHPRRCQNGCYSFFNKGHPNDTGPISCD